MPTNPTTSQIKNQSGVVGATASAALDHLSSETQANAAGILAHTGNTANPHSVTAAQAGADPVGTAAAAVVAHVGGSDPHTQYAKETDLAANSGSSLVGLVQSGTGAVATTVQAKLREHVSVKDFGAVGDGVTDDTAAIQAAINYAKVNQNSEVYFPPHNQSAYYKTTAPIVIDRAISIRGDSPSTTILSVGLTASQYIIDYNCLAVDVVEHAFIKGLTLRTADSVASALRLKNISYVTCKDVRVYTVLHGVYLEGTRCFSNAFEELNSYNVAGETVKFDNSFTGGGHFTFTGCTFTGNTGVTVPNGIATDGLTFTGCNFEQCVTNSLFVGGSVRGLALIGCRTEGCNGDDFLINPSSGNAVEGLSITGTSFTTDAPASRPIILGGAGGTVRGFSITGNQVEYAGAGTSFVYLNGDGESGIVAGNYFAQPTTTPTNVQRAGVIVFGNENSTGKCTEYWGGSAWGVTEVDWTPVDGSGAGLSLVGSGRATKIGRMVFWQAFVSYPTTANGASAEFGGLPYPVGALGGHAYGRSGAGVNLTDYGGPLGLLQGVLSANTNVAIVNRDTGAILTNANVSGKYMYCSGMYSIGG